MNSTEKEIFYTTTKPYSTLNTLTEKTKQVWFVCHGMGYLSQYFLRYFKSLNSEENYIIAPQAPSLYYQGSEFRHVGANWLTKNNTLRETENIMNYFDAVLAAEELPDSVNLVVLGYSQGVSVATRYVAKRQLKCSQLILHSGGLPKELEPADFSFSKAKVSLVYGTKDQYLNEARISYEISRVQTLFGDAVSILPFEGVHEVNTKIISSLV